MGDIIGVFGVPCVGKGSVAKAVHERMLERYRIATFSTSDLVKKIITDEDKEAMRNGALFPREQELRDLIYEYIEALWAFGTEVIIVDGLPRFDDQVRWMRQVFFDHNLHVVQVLGPSDFELVRRASVRARDEFDTNPGLCMGRINHQRGHFPGIERMINQYGLPYCSVINDSIEGAAAQMIGKIKWPEIERKPPRQQKEA